MELVVSELFANAEVHGAGTIEVVSSSDGDLVRLEVRDEGGGTPTMQPRDPTGTRIGGWGLQLVDQLAQDGGAEVSDDRTIVWAERELRSAPDPRQRGEAAERRGQRQSGK